MLPSLYRISRSRIYSSATSFRFYRLRLKSPPRWRLPPLRSSRRGDHHSRMNAINIIQMEKAECRFAGVATNRDRWKREIAFHLRVESSSSSSFPWNPILSRSSTYPNTFFYAARPNFSSSSSSSLSTRQPFVFFSSRQLLPPFALSVPIPTPFSSIHPLDKVSLLLDISRDKNLTCRKI